jgi:hypothetical protein
MLKKLIYTLCIVLNKLENINIFDKSVGCFEGVLEFNLAASKLPTKKAIRSYA